MIAAAREHGGRRRVSRAALLSAVGAAHLLAIWAILRPQPITAVDEAPALALFDVVAPPPAPSPPPLPRPATRSPETRVAPAAPPSGGSPGHRRERPARQTNVLAPPALEALDPTLTPLVRDPPPLSAAGSAVADLALGGAAGSGTGSGAGAGPGSGDGRGAGGDDLDGYARGAWVRTPPAEIYARYWPWRFRKLSAPVTVRLSCSVRRNGRPYGCDVRSEAPNGLGFGRTALAVLPAARVKPMARNGATLWDAPVLITMVFESIETAPRLHR